jgi:RNA polymerase sigma-70 factor (ECF subfamily)
MLKPDDKRLSTDYDEVTLSMPTALTPEFNRFRRSNFNLGHRRPTRLSMSEIESSRDHRLHDALQGDEDALATLLMDYRPYLHLLAKRGLDSAIHARVGASDIVQQTCLEACRDFSEFQGRNEPAFIAWLKRILHNNVSESVHRHITAKKRSVHRERRLAPQNDSQALPEYVDREQSSPSQRVMRGEMMLELASKLESLPATQSEALRLRYLEGMALAEISKRMDKTPMAVAGLLKRGLRQLRSFFPDKT